MEKDPKIFLRHILESIEAIEKYLANTPEDKFFDDLQAQDAVIRRFEIIGEATRNISDEFKNKHPEIPWPKMIGMRNELIHEYFGVDAELVLATAKEKLPELKEQIKKLI